MVVVEGKECQLRPAGSHAARTCHVVSLMRASSHVRGEQRALLSRRLRLRTHAACFTKDYCHLIVLCKSPIMHCAPGDLHELPSRAMHNVVSRRPLSVYITQSTAAWYYLFTLRV
jgi:hypothetical protein